MNKQEKLKKISIGVEDFKTIIEKDGYFVDKTLMIQNLIKSNAMVTLFTRPRRFGKTLNQFMIRRFFEDERTEKGEKIDNGGLFDGLAITQCGEEILSASAAVSGDFFDLKVSEAGYVCARLHGIKETPERGVQAAQICFDGRHPDNG